MSTIISFRYSQRPALVKNYKLNNTYYCKFVTLRWPRLDFGGIQFKNKNAMLKNENKKILFAIKNTSVH